LIDEGQGDLSRAKLQPTATFLKSWDYENNEAMGPLFGFGIFGSVMQQTASL